MSASAGQLATHVLLVIVLVAAAVVLTMAGKITGDQGVALIVAAGGLGGLGTVGVFRNPQGGG